MSFIGILLNLSNKLKKFDEHSRDYILREELICINDWIKSQKSLYDKDNLSCWLFEGIIFPFDSNRNYQVFFFC